MYVCHFSAFLSWNYCGVKIIILVIHGDETGIEEEVNVDGKIFKVCKMENFCSNNFGYKKKSHKVSFNVFDFDQNWLSFLAL